MRKKAVIIANVLLLVIILVVGRIIYKGVKEIKEIENPRDAGKAFGEFAIEVEKAAKEFKEGVDEVKNDTLNEVEDSYYTEDENW